MIKRIIEVAIILIFVGLFIYIGRGKLAANYYNRGVEYFDRAKYSQAIDYLKRSLEIDPLRAPTHYTLAGTYSANNMEDKAIQEYKKTIELDTNYIPAYSSLAEIELNHERFEEANNLVNKALAKAPTNSKLKDLQGRIAFGYAAKCLYDGVDAFLANNKPKAFELLNKALEIKPDFAYTYYILGSLYHAENKLSEAKEKLEQAVVLDHKLWLGFKLLGDIYFEEKNYPSAIENYKKAVSINNKDAGLQNNLGLALMEEESYGEAIVFLKEAVRLDPKNINLRYGLASVYRDKADPEQAIREYRKIIEIVPDYPNIHNDLGDIFTAAGNDIEAEKEYQQEIELDQRKLAQDPDNPAALYALSRANFGLKEYDLAKEFVEKAIRIDSKNRDFYLMLGQIEKKLGNYDASLDSLNKSKELSPGVKFIERDIEDLKKNLAP
ncbi:MAG: tetratricopeptide repeat protein [Candidatus Omnitrophica bacterium]|nr:tetratricopeptide repeat protein [Candidatus Omnitrophota bacterium]